jgi:Fibronectin type III domain
MVRVEGATRTHETRHVTITRENMKNRSGRARPRAAHLIGLALTPVLLLAAASVASAESPPSDATDPAATATEQAPTDTEATPPTTEAAPPTTEAAPPTTEAAPPTTEAAPPTTEAAPPTTEAAPPTTEAAPPTTEAAPPTTEAAPPVSAPPTKAGSEPWAPMLVAVPAGVTATATADCAKGTASVAGYAPDETHTAYLELTYGDSTIRTQARLVNGEWHGSIDRPTYWPSDAVWWVAVTVDDANGDAFAAAHVPYTCRLPRAPQSYYATPGPGRATLSWFQNGTLPVTDYVIQRSTDATSWVTLNDGVSTATTYTATGLTNNVTYYFRIAAVGANGQGAYSFALSARPMAVPTVVRTVTATAGPLSTVVKWVAPASGTPYYYLVQYSTNRTSWTEQYASSSTRTYRITGLAPGVRYYVRMIAVNQSGKGPVSPMVSAIPTAASRPSAPFDVRLLTVQTDGDAFVFVAPDYNGGRTIISANVKCISTNGGVTRTGSAVGLYPYYVLVGNLTKLKTYRCTATLGNRLGTGPARTSAAFVVPVRPAAPTAVKAVVSGGLVTVTFTKTPAPNPIDYYEAICTSSNGGQLRSGFIQAKAAASIRIFGLTSGKRYACRVQAFNMVGTGPFSAASAAFIAP